MAKFLLTIFFVMAALPLLRAQTIYSGTALVNYGDGPFGGGSDIPVINDYYRRTPAHVDSFPPAINQTFNVRFEYDGDSLLLFLFETEKKPTAKFIRPLEKDSIQTFSYTNYDLTFLKVIDITGDSLICWIRSNRVYEQLVENNGGSGHHYEQYWQHTIGTMYLKQRSSEVSSSHHSEGKELLYPNPTNNIIIVPVEENTIPLFKIYAPDGKEFDCDVRERSAKNMAIDVSQLTRGVYFLRFENQSNKAYKFCKF